MPNPILHPLIYPEKYFNFNPSIKSIYLSTDTSVVPQILTDFYDKSLQYTFSQNENHIYLIDPYIFFHASQSLMPEKNKNMLATMFFRNKVLVNFGYVPSDYIYGPVLITGSYNPIIHGIDGNHHSVPYHIVEEVLELYDLLQSVK